MKPAIEIRDLSKEYRITSSAPYMALREVITGSVRNIFRSGTRAKEKFFALKDIDLDIMPGERVGIIGRNGAGKSTLLKIISRITPPTRGSAIVRGRVGSLLEVGTGFHPELTGRENIYLNGSILGLKKVEIDRQLDAIIDFSGVEKFIDTPLKHYSSGMQLRLAFSVAAHLDPEILLIDEVLAVGDIAFQKKCMGKMDEVSKNGRTILFVSHNLGAVQSLCNKTLYLSNGQIEKFDQTELVIPAYLQQSATALLNTQSYGNGKATIISCSLGSGENNVTDILLGYPATLNANLQANQDLQQMEVAFNIRNVYGEIVTHSTTLDEGLELSATTNEVINIAANMQSLNITPGSYSVDLFVLDKGEICHALTSCLEFSVLNSDKVMRPDGFPAHVRTYTATNWKKG